MSKSISRFRNASFSRQNGLYYYCDLPMWLNDPAQISAWLTPDASRMQWLNPGGCKSRLQQLGQFDQEGVSETLTLF